MPRKTSPDVGLGSLSEEVLLRVREWGSAGQGGQERESREAGSIKGTWQVGEQKRLLWGWVVGQEGAGWTLWGLQDYSPWAMSRS